MSRVLFYLLLLLLCSCGPPPKWLQDPSRLPPVPPEYMHVLDLNADRDSTAKFDSFHILSNEVTTTPSMYVGHLIISVQVDEIKLDKIYDALAENAIEFGANAFQIVHARATPADELLEIEIKLYAASNIFLSQNDDNFPSNLIYVVGDTYPRGKTKKFKVNGEPKSVAPMTYVSFENKPGDKTKLSIGGLLGASMTFKGTEDRASVYVSLSRFGIRPVFGRNSMHQTGVGVSFNTGRIHPVESEFGRFLTRVLQKHKDAT